jgi:hypothetical protein
VNPPITERPRERIPLLIRLYAAIARAVDKATNFHTMVWQEVLWSWTRPEERAAVNRMMWDASDDYLPGGVEYAQGLHDWERRAILDPVFPQSGRILLAAAGGGRELGPLLKMGFDVVAFEPSPKLCAASQEMAALYPRSIVIRASFEDLVEAATRRTGPLAPYVLKEPFDAVILGWTSFTFLITADERRELLLAARATAPKAPLLLSFAAQDRLKQNRTERWRPRVGRICRLLGAPSSRDPGDRFVPKMGFWHYLTKEEFHAAVQGAGYRIFYSAWGPLPYAMLMPE